MDVKSCIGHSIPQCIVSSNKLVKNTQKYSVNDRISEFFRVVLGNQIQDALFNVWQWQILDHKYTAHIDVTMRILTGDHTSQLPPLSIRYKLEFVLIFLWHLNGSVYSLIREPHEQGRSLIDSIFLYYILCSSCVYMCWVKTIWAVERSCALVKVHCWLLRKLPTNIAKQWVTTIIGSCI